MRYYVRLVLLVLITSFVVNNDGFPLDIEEEFKVGFDYKCRAEIESLVRDSDFCIVGKIRVRQKEIIKEGDVVDENGKVIDKFPVIWKVVGDIEVESIIYGDPESKLIPFSTIQDEEGWPTPEERQYPLGEAPPSSKPQDLWKGLRPEEGDIYIILGKGRGKETSVIKPIKRESIKAINSTIECLRTIRAIESLEEKEARKERERLLLESNNIEILWYLFRKALQEGGMEGAITMVEDLFSKGKVTPERKFISYCFVMHIFEPPCVRNIYGKCWKVLPPYRQYKEITPAQSQRLKEIIVKSFSEIKTIEEGINYLKYLSSIILEEDADLKDSIKKITENLSRQFEKEKDYSEWEKWVKENFFK